MAAVPWQIHNSASWNDLDASASAKLESHFNNPACSSIVITLKRFGTVTLDLDNMTLEQYPLRRNKSDGLMDVEYWDDQAWVMFDKYAATCVNDCLAIGRRRVTVYIGDQGYTLLVDPANYLQINKSTHRARPLRVTGAMLLRLDEDKPPSYTIADDESIPNEYRCPITTMAMLSPVCAADGHSYERGALETWLQKKHTSPVTGKALQHTGIVPNFTLRKAIYQFAFDNGLLYEEADEADDAASVEAADTAGPSKKRMRLMSKV